MRKANGYHCKHHPETSVMGARTERREMDAFRDIVCFQDISFQDSRSSHPFGGQRTLLHQVQPGPGGPLHRIVCFDVRIEYRFRHGVGIEALPGSHRPVDRAYVHDGTGVLTLEAWRALESGTIACPGRDYVLFDHIVPANTSTTADLQHELRLFARGAGMHFSDIGDGICHQLMGEGAALPGEIIVGADSHTCTLGAFGAFATGVGATDMAVIWASGSTWFKVPETIALFLSGRLSGHAEAKDLALTYVSRLGMDGASYQALEFIGEGVTHLSDRKSVV